MKSFTKPSLTIEQQLDLLKERGLLVSEDQQDQGLQVLQMITLFRLGPYMRPFQVANDEKHKFQENAKLTDIIEIYQFDSDLRRTVMDALEQVEIAVRASITSHMCIQCNSSHWYTVKSNFKCNYEYEKLIREIKNKQLKEKDGFERECNKINKKNISPEKKEKLIDHRKRDNYARFYACTYSDPELPPSWAVFEDLTMGAISKLFEGLAKDSDRKNIADNFGVPGEVMTSWLHTLTFVRNICAHHCRLWNRELSVPPKLLRVWNDLDINQHPQPNRRVFIVATLLAHLTSYINPDNLWSKRFVNLIEASPDVPFLLPAMGFPKNWRKLLPWKRI